jgi:hypothetical protein
MCISDGEVTEEEARYLHQWVRANDDCLNEYVAGAIAGRLLVIFSDGRIDQEERHELEELLKEAVGASEILVHRLNDIIAKVETGDFEGPRADAYLSRWMRNLDKTGIPNRALEEARRYTNLLATDHLHPRDPQPAQAIAALVSAKELFE